METTPPRKLAPQHLIEINEKKELDQLPLQVRSSAFSYNGVLQSALDIYRPKALAPVVQTLDSAIHRINHYPADKYYGNQLRYPLDSDLSGGWHNPTFEQPGPDLDIGHSPICSKRGGLNTEAVTLVT